jgi:hypothetical protein
MLASMSKAISAAGVNIGTCFTCFTFFAGTKLETLRVGFCPQLAHMPATRRACTSLPLERKSATRALVCHWSARLQLDDLLALLVHNYKHKAQGAASVAAQHTGVCRRMLLMCVCVRVLSVAASAPSTTSATSATSARSTCRAPRTLQKKGGGGGKGKYIENIDTFFTCFFSFFLFFSVGGAEETACWTRPRALRSHAVVVCAGILRSAD